MMKAMRDIGNHARMLLLSAALLCAACGHAGKRADLVFLNGAEPETLDPALITGQPEERVVMGLFEGLLAFDAAGNTVPGVAESWDISPDKRVYTFHLRHDARWSNGDAITAQDFVDSWRRAVEPETASDYASQLYFIKNGRPLNEGTLKDVSQFGVKKIDGYTLEVTLENPTPFFLELCALPTLYPVYMPGVKKYGDEWIKPGNMVCNGAFTLVDWRINDRIRLAKNPTYWDAAHVRLNTIDILPTSNANTALNFFALGEADLMMDKGLTPVSLMNELKKRQDFHSAPFFGTYFLRFNCTRPPFNDARVRKAFALVVDKELLVDKITRAGEKPASSFVPPGTPYQSPPGLARDTDLARKLLADAGYPGGKNFPHVNYLYDDRDLNEKIAVELQSMFTKELGVDVGLLKQEWKVYLNSMSRVDYDMCRSSWVGDYTDANTFLNMFVTGDGNNRTGFSNANYDGWIADAAKEPDIEKRFDIFRKAETMLVDEEAPICPLYYYVGIQLYDGKKFGGIEANLLDEHPLKEMYRKSE